MLAVADTPTQAAVHALVCGLSVEELLATRWNQVHLNEQRLEIIGGSARRLAIAGPAGEALKALVVPGGSPATPVWHDKNEGCLTRDALDAMLSAAAYRANVDGAGEITADTLRHTYISFLLRQGAKLDALPAAVGVMTPEMVELYASAGLTHGQKTLDAVDMSYPINT